ncbi:polysaccharide biosynthesis/export family protein [Mesorhizobium sp. BAC0120]|uniref:polysaccharide biosynthesis/export family protein n=1 Tax=Mesorhizobium sp. BAC0120 TaxID=3090670 RepID=UPI00298CBF9E|nr:polysaccharide biosynthesis/export family protein [Mesorhizobium sp. BAC0120]MDW6023079.1 polysaccharide biosynthesis/export family protein [Mesorhizobium sp. BAC0120]
MSSSRLMRYAAAGAIVLACSLSAFAQSEGEPASKEDLETLPVPDITFAERLSLRFQDHPELSGDYRVSPDNTLSVPVVGRMNVAGLSLVGLEQLIAKRATELAGNATYVTAEIAAYRPIFVSGDVSRSGSIEWRPGLTVLQAEALAGGLFRPQEQTAGGGSMIDTDKTLRKIEDQRNRLLASVARLKAEKEGLNKIAIPPELIELAGKGEATSLILEQQALMDARSAALTKQLSSLENGSNTAEQELQGLNDQAARVDEQLQKLREMQGRVATLLQKGLVEKERSLEGELRISQLEEKAIEIAVSRARVQGVVAGLQQNAVTLKEDRKAAIDTEISSKQAELAQIEIDYQAANQTYREQSAQGEHVRGTASLPQPTTEYTIVRRNESGERQLTAKTSSYLRPGDVLLVTRHVSGPGATDDKERTAADRSQ